MPDVPAPNVVQTAAPPPIIIQQMPAQPFWLRRWFVRLLLMAVVFLLLYCVSLNSAYQQYFHNGNLPAERFHSGNKQSDDKIALIHISGTIMPPFTGQILEAIKKAKDDEHVKGVVLVIDSPGGLVADSHQIYEKLKKLRDSKPVFVSMKRMAASGGVYIAMGCGENGKIFAEPTTWTGSIGVIIPRYDVSQMAEKFGVKTDSLKTGEFKDSLDPLRPLTDRERDLWGRILDESFQRFLKIIDDNRKPLDADKVKSLATGQLFTAAEAKDHGLIDEIGDEDAAIEALKMHLGLGEARVVEYQFPASLMSVLLGTAENADPETRFRKLLELSVPRAMYFCGSIPAMTPLWPAFNDRIP